jgi:hypothetical protein
MGKLIVAVFLAAGILQANDVVCPGTRIYVSVDKEIIQAHPRAEDMPQVLKMLDHIFKTDPNCKCILKVLLYPNGSLRYQCLAKR